MISRKHFITTGALSAITILTSGTSTILSAQEVNKVKPPSLDKDLFKEFVVKGHSDLEAVKTLLEQEPGLLNAAWDWGGGDFETALEGAGHVGNKAIANFLISKGARMNIFCAAMLGQLDIVKQIITANPDLRFSKGPHSLQLLHHAKKGGEEAKPVLEYIESIGAN